MLFIFIKEERPALSDNSGLNVSEEANPRKAILEKMSQFSGFHNFWGIILPLEVLFNNKQSEHMQ